MHYTKKFTLCYNLTGCLFPFDTVASFAFFFFFSIPVVFISSQKHQLTSPENTILQSKAITLIASWIGWIPNMNLASSSKCFGVLDRPSPNVSIDFVFKGDLKFLSQFNSMWLC